MRRLDKNIQRRAQAEADGDVSIAGLGEAGDLYAPPGSQPWAIAVRHELQGTLGRLEFERGHLAQIRHLMQQHEGYKQLYDRRGRPFSDYAAFCREPEPWGLGMDEEGGASNFHDTAGYRRLTEAYLD
jgi:hypothetical protein